MYLHNFEIVTQFINFQNAHYNFQNCTNFHFFGEVFRPFVVVISPKFWWLTHRQTDRTNYLTRLRMPKQVISRSLRPPEEGSNLAESSQLTHQCQLALGQLNHMYLRSYHLHVACFLPSGTWATAFPMSHRLIFPTWQLVIIPIPTTWIANAPHPTCKWNYPSLLHGPQTLHAHPNTAHP